MGGGRLSRGIRAATLFLAALFAADSTLAEEELLPVIDLHVDLPYQSLYKGAAFADGSGQFAARNLKYAGVSGVVMPLYIPEKPYGRTLLELERSYAHVFQNLMNVAPYSLPGCSVGRSGKQPRMVATWLAFEDAGQVPADEMEVRRWTMRGVRSFGLVHTQSNRLAASSGGGGPAPRDTGLTEEGRKFVHLVYQVGGFVDVSHASDRATDEIISIAAKLGKPAVATHSNARSLAPHTRNLTDEHIQGIAATGGVVGVNFHQPFLEKKKGQGATLSDVVRQVQHLTRLGGVDAVAIGSDFEGGIKPVAELADVTKYQILGKALVEAGFSKKDVKKIFAENALRVLCSGS
jgi:membrane dipeptidase